MSNPEPTQAVPDVGMSDSNEVERSALAAEPPQTPSSMSSDGSTSDSSVAGKPKTPRKRAAKKST